MQLPEKQHGGRVPLPARRPLPGLERHSLWRRLRHHRHASSAGYLGLRSGMASQSRPSRAKMECAIHIPWFVGRNEQWKIANVVLAKTSRADAWATGNAAECLPGFQGSFDSLQEVCFETRCGVPHTPLAPSEPFIVNPSLLLSFSCSTTGQNCRV